MRTTVFLRFLLNSLPLVSIIFDFLGFHANGICGLVDGTHLCAKVGKLAKIPSSILEVGHFDSTYLFSRDSNVRPSESLSVSN